VRGPRAAPRLYDPRTGEELRRQQAPSRALVFGIAALACGALFALAHHELPFLAHWAGACSPDDYAYECTVRGRYGALGGAGLAALLGALFALAHRYRRFPPTLTCRGCGTSGFVLDIEPHGGRCPLCGGERFDYRIWFGTGTGAGPRLERVVEEDRAGPDLVRRFRETRTSATRRYY
jgi:hypothetical protein